MASYTSSKASSTVKSNASAETFTFDISSALAAANIPAHSNVTKLTITVWGDIDTASNKGKMSASFGPTSICSNVDAGGSAGEVSRSTGILSYIYTDGANAGKLIDSSTRLSITLDGPFMVAKFNHTASWQIYIEWTPHAHAYNSTVTKEATCTETGIRTFTCSCGEGSYTESIPCIEHRWGETTYPKDATCISTGNTAYTKCTRCNLYYAGNAPSSFATGGKSDTSSFITPINPNYHVGGNEVRNAVAGTCGAEGYTGDEYCKSCGALVIKGSIIEAYGHRFSPTIAAKEATCTTTGNSAYKRCIRCNLVFAEDATTNSTAGASDESSFFIDVKGHNYTSQVIKPTAAVDGYTLHTCQNGCGDSYKDNYTINKIFYGTTQPSEIFFGDQKVKEVYYGTTKVYGPK